MQQAPKGTTTTNVRMANSVAKTKFMAATKIQRPNRRLAMGRRKVKPKRAVRGRA
jgi:hypothetical protein